jgi:peptidoglycan-associated lipoprotein
MRLNTALTHSLLAAMVLTAAACSTPRGPAAVGGGPGGPGGPGGIGGPGGVGSNVLPGTTQDFVINVGEYVYFDTDQFALRNDAVPILDGQARWLSNYPQVRVRIEGNADERGTREYNFALGARRANTVREYLVSHGIDGSRIETISYGKEHPIDPGSTEEAWGHNRNAHTALISGTR